MITICKYPIQQARSDIVIPYIKILQAVICDDVVCLYALVNTSDKFKKVTVYVLSTNDDFAKLTNDGIKSITYLNSVQIVKGIWHVFYELH